MACGMLLILMPESKSLSRLFIVFGSLLIFCGLAVAVVSSQDEPKPLPPTVSGVVLDENGPLVGAVVQIQGTPNQTLTADNGMFMLSGIEGSEPIVLTAWSAGYYIGWATVDPNAPDWQGSDAIHITLQSLPQGDNSEYHWFSFEGVDGSASCGLCHREYPEWQADQHSQSAVNQRFISMYTGMNVHGEEGQPVRYGSDGLPLPPDPNEPYTGPGFLRDNPGRAGSCATCHTPVASKLPNNQNCSWSGCHVSSTVERSNGALSYASSPINLTGDAAEGITCEFCHKVGDVILDPETQMPLADMPGILSMRLHRPFDDSEQVFFGTLIDVLRQDSYLPLLSESKFCAACHFGVFGGVVGNMTVTGGKVIYNSYGEWLESPYSDPETGATCQDCHMPQSDANWFVLPERGGITRDYAELHNHTMPGAADEQLLQNSVTMTTSAERDGDQLHVQVSITNDKTGHHVPTDAPIRSMILVVERDADGNLLVLDEGPINPDYSGDLGGLPGKTFAKVLQDDWTGEMPTGAFWRPVTIVEDTRLAAMATDTTEYTFNAPAGEVLTVNVRLVFRRAFYELSQQKGWSDPDILMEHESLTISE
jgi:hypothetical protein